MQVCDAAHFVFGCSHVFDTVEQNSIEIWKYEMYFLVMEYDKKTAFVPPFSIVIHILLLIRWLAYKICRKQQPESKYKLTFCCTIIFLNFRTPQTFAVITLMVKYRNCTIKLCFKRMQTELKTVKTRSYRSSRSMGIGSALFAKNCMSENLGSLFQH